MSEKETYGNRLVDVDANDALTLNWTARIIPNPLSTRHRLTTIVNQRITNRQTICIVGLYFNHLIRLNNEHDADNYEYYA